MGWEVHFRLSCVVFAVQPCPSGQAVTLAETFPAPRVQGFPILHGSHGEVGRGRGVEMTCAIPEAPNVGASVWPSGFPSCGGECKTWSSGAICLEGFLASQCLRN